ncbi:hypothetical protein PFISCL1PPCAC_6029, partial [Pristionchus fissidentatus]
SSSSLVYQQPRFVRHSSYDIPSYGHIHSLPLSPPSSFNSNSASDRVDAPTLSTPTQTTPTQVQPTSLIYENPTLPPSWNSIGGYALSPQVQHNVNEMVEVPIPIGYGGVNGRFNGEYPTQPQFPQFSPNF